MATRWQPLTIQQGDTFEFIVAITGGPSDLTGFTARMDIRPNKLSDVLLLELATGDGLTLDPSLRRVTIEISDEITGALDWINPAVYDLKMEGGGKTWRLMEGTVYLNHTVTV